MSKILFHIGRGGRFYNAGYKTCKGIIDKFDPEHYGINIYYDDQEDNPDVRLDNGKVVCSLKELNSDSGSFNIDNDYDTYLWYPIDELDESELEILVRDLEPYEYKDLLIALGLDKRIFEILEKKIELNKLIEYFIYKISFEEFIRLEEVLIFDNEEEAWNNGGQDILEIEGIFYVLN